MKHIHVASCQDLYNGIELDDSSFMFVLEVAEHAKAQGSLVQTLCHCGGCFTKFFSQGSYHKSRGYCCRKFEQLGRSASRIQSETSGGRRGCEYASSVEASGFPAQLLSGI